MYICVACGILIQCHQSIQLICSLVYVVMPVNVITLGRKLISFNPGIDNEKTFTLNQYQKLIMVSLITS